VFVRASERKGVSGQRRVSRAVEQTAQAARVHAVGVLPAVLGVDQARPHDRVRRHDPHDDGRRGRQRCQSGPAVGGRQSPDGAVRRQRRARGYAGRAHRPPSLEPRLRGERRRHRRRGMNGDLAVTMKGAGQSVRWHLDVAKGVATSEKPGDHLAGYTVPHGAEPRRAPLLRRRPCRPGRRRADRRRARDLPRRRGHGRRHPSGRPPSIG